MLALELGSTVSELQDRMSSSEFSEWRAFHSIEPFGSLRSDFQSGQICSTVANLFTDEKFKVQDFMLGENDNENRKPKMRPTKNSKKKSDETVAFLEAMGAVRTK